jgi:MFS family permease
MFCTSRSSFLATGFLVGALESGFIPGSLYYISTWYKSGEYAVRNTAFFLGQLGATAISGVLASGILSLAGRSGLAGWQWLFMLEGVMTVCIGILWLFFLPETPSKCSPILFPKWKMFTPREVQILATRVIVHDAQKSAGARVHIGFRDVLHVLTNWRIWQHVMLSFIGMIPGQGLSMDLRYPWLIIRPLLPSYYSVLRF